MASFQRLLRPVLEKLDAQRIRQRGPSSLLPIQASRQIAGAEVGTILGWMSTRVLGQYDQLIIEEENPEDQDMVYYVGPNVVRSSGDTGSRRESSVSGWRSTR